MSAVAIHDTAADFDVGSSDGHTEVLASGGVQLRKLAGSLGAWASAGDLPLPLWGPVCWSTRGRLYVGGGYLTNSPCSITSTVYSADLDGSGNLSAWSWRGDLPILRTHSVVARWADKLYIGGGSTCSSSVNDLWMGTLAADGMVLAWNSVTPPPFAEGRLVAVQGKLYFLCSDEGVGYGSARTYVADIQKDGTPGAWALAPARPVNLSKFGAAAAMGRLFTLGGESGDYLGESTVQAAGYDDQGVLGAWAVQAGTPMPQPRSYFGVGGDMDAYGKIFVVGGKTGSPDTAHPEAYASTLSSGGILSAWTPEGLLPAGNNRAVGVLMASAGKLFYVGGSRDLSSPSPQSVSVFAASLNTGTANASAGVFIGRFDLGSDMVLADLVVSLTAGTDASQVKVRARLATSAGSFGSWMPAGGPAFPALNLGVTARYVEYQLHFFDSFSSVDAGVDRVEITFPTATLTVTPSDTVSPSPTATETASPSPTSTETGTETPTPSVTLTATETLLLSPTVTPSVTPTCTITATISTSPTFSPVILIPGLGTQIYPNPYNPDKGQAFHIGNVPAGETMTIYNMIGELVYTQKLKGNPALDTWDGMNRNGVKVVTGIYFVVVTGNQQVLRMAVVRN